jgi:EAL domain-containing protein (putative c-di-GMP-specific phosphodiesterase class I)
MRAVDGHVAGSEEFLDVAESTGLAVPVGTGLLDHACGEIARWTRELGPAAPGMVSVPCSSRQLRGRRAAAQVAAVIANHGVRASSLCLEISEASLVDADDTVRRTLEELKTSGVRLAIDDFGGGRTSLTSLRHFGIDMIRIDRSLLTGLGEGGDTEVVRAVVGLGHALGITTIAKGVDSEAQAGALAGIGCELAQGNLFGPARERVLSS